MIKVNPITISTPTRFQVAFDLAPPYTAAEIKVAGDGTWSAQCGVVERLGTNPVPEYGTIFTEGAHNIAPHQGEPLPCISGFYNHIGVDYDQTPWDPDYPPGTYAIAADPVDHGKKGHFDKVWVVYSAVPGVPKAWRVEVNIIHGTEEEVADAHRRRNAGCLVPWWWWPMPMGPDHARRRFEQMLRTGDVTVGPAVAAATPKKKSTRARPVKKTANKPKSATKKKKPK